jgi:hypothetical protein
MPDTYSLEDRALLSRRRKKQRWRRNARRHVATMRVRGFSLQLTHGDIRGPIWCLSDGTRIEHGAAQIMLGEKHVIPVGDCLFMGARSQTYRYVE